jgi:hypothetical protein
LFFQTRTSLTKLLTDSSSQKTKANEPKLLWFVFKDGLIDSLSSFHYRLFWANFRLTIWLTQVGCEGRLERTGDRSGQRATGCHLWQSRDWWVDLQLHLCSFPLSSVLLLDCHLSSGESEKLKTDSMSTYDLAEDVLFIAHTLFPNTQIYLLGIS